jgi:hypothetical protein
VTPTSILPTPQTAAEPIPPRGSAELRVNDDCIANDAPFNAPRVLGLIVISLLPFWAVPIAHVASNPQTATGFFHYELPYYVANGRAAFERGNGIFYPNPYDPAPESPAIYAHWLPWLLGLATACFKFDPGDVILSLTFCASIAFAWATWSLVQHRTSSHRANRGSPGGNLTFLLAMWGGGLLCFAGTAVAGLQSTPWLESVLQFDPGNGMWFLNWGRNALFPTEAVYHTLVACCWLAEIKTQKRVANGCLLLLATTHPWSGLELLLTINLWRGVQFLRHRTVSARNQLSISVSLLVTFLLYYKVWLSTFPQHAKLQQVWELDWSLSWTSALLAYIPVFIPCAVLIVRKLVQSSPNDVSPDSPGVVIPEPGKQLASYSAGVFNRTEQFLLCALLVATGLAFHDRIIKPVQPLHFTRGYMWLPMFLIGLPVIMEWWNHVHRRIPQYAVVLLALVVVADNFVFSAVHIDRQLTQVDGFHLDTGERTLLASLHGQRGPVLLESTELNYLLPSYADARPWLGHHFNTPLFPERQAAYHSCFPTDGLDPVNIPDDVCVLVVRRLRDTERLVASPVWRRAARTTGWDVWKRRVRQTVTRAGTDHHNDNLKVKYVRVESL